MPKKPDICETIRCKNKARSKGMCSSCLSWEWKRNNPVEYAYQTNKGNAKRRGHKFELTLEEFRELAIETDYLVGKGITKTGLTLDRERDELGYVKGNIKVITNSENIKKEHRRRKVLKYEYQTKMAFYVEIKEVSKDDAPF